MDLRFGPLSPWLQNGRNNSLIWPEPDSGRWSDDHAGYGLATGAMPGERRDVPDPVGQYGSMMRPLSFWLYVGAGIVMIIASAIALPFVALRSR
jgi:hypothetical protein